MDSGDTISRVLARSRFLSSRSEVERTAPNIIESVPPLTKLSLKEAKVGDGVHGYPVVPGPELIELLVHFLAEAVESAFLEGAGEQSRIQTDMERFQQEPYFSELVELVAETRAHGTVFKLDSVLWIHLSELTSRLLHPDDEALQWTRDHCPGVRDEALSILARLDERVGGTDAELARVRRTALHALVARNEFANRSVARMVGDDSPNSLHQSLVSNRLAFLLPSGFLANFLPRQLTTAKDVGLRATQITDLVRALRAIVQDLYTHRDDRALSGTEQYFVTKYLRPTVLAKLDSLDLERFTGHGDLPDDGYDTVTGFKAGWVLAFDDDVVRFVLSQIEQLNVRRALGGIHGQFSGKFLRHLAAPERLRAQQSKILSFARLIRQLDLFRALQSFLLTVEERQGSYFLGDDVIRSSAVPLDLGSYYETFRRNRSGCAVFVDLIGFTNKAREVFFGRSQGNAARDMEQSERGELAALALERLFQVRQELLAFGGRPEGFEGDAILDIFPEPLSALRYVNRFQANYREHRAVQFRPFSKPVKNPFAQEGFRVGIATGDYTLVNVPDIDPGGDLHVRLRAIGPSINKASRLNTGKRGATEQFVTSTRDRSKGGDPDPLDLFNVQVLEDDLNNTGICIDVHTLDELREVAQREGLPCWMPRGDFTFEIEGNDAVPKLYRFDLIVHDAEYDSVYALRRLARVPRLKGLSQSESVVIEVLPFTVEDYRQFIVEDRRLAEQQDEVGVGSTASLSQELKAEGSDHLSAELPEYLFGRSQESDPGGELGRSGDHGLAWSNESVERDRVSADSLEEVLGDEGRLSLDGSFADSDEDLGDGSWGDVPETAPQQPDDAEEDWDEAQLHEHMRDVFDALSDDHSEDTGDALFDEPVGRVEGDSGVVASAPNGPDEQQEVAETVQEAPPLSPLGLEDVVEEEFVEPSRPSAWIEEMPDADAIGGIVAPDPDISEDSWDPGPARVAAMAPDDGVDVLGPLDDEFAARLAQIRGKSQPGCEADKSVPHTATVGRRDLRRILKDYHFAVRVEQGKQEILFGRLVGHSLFDLHQYTLPTQPGVSSEFDRALQLFLEDKVREEFLPYSTRYGELPADASEPMPVPVDRAFTVLRGFR